MNITIDGHPVVIFSGARVIDALRKFDPALARQLTQGTLRVVDAWGHETRGDGELTEGQSLRTEATERSPSPEHP